MKLVFLDAKTIGSDINLSAFETLGEVVYYDFTTPDEASIKAGTPTSSSSIKQKSTQKPLGRHPT